jgi:glycosyltransferase involved in cell wall biosynthesis
MYFLLAPYYISYYVFEDTRRFSEVATSTAKETKVAHFTDTFYDINGVAKSLQKSLEIARKNKRNLDFVTCENTDSLYGEKVFRPLKKYDLPEYPESKLTCPPVLDILEHCYKENYTHIHSATPGTLGLVALLVAKILKKPFYTTYHTAFPQYVRELIDEPLLESFAWKYMQWYYSYSDKIFVPSKAFREDLLNNGFPKDKIVIMPRGIDTEHFSPKNKYLNGNFILLYVGRVSKEKNLDILTEAFMQIDRDDVILRIVGDGPYKEELQEKMKGFKVEFTGYLEGKDLLDAYHTSDVFVFPSTTDTFGNVILEAHSCGIPTVVTDVGGPQENVIEGKTGTIVRGLDVVDLKRGILSMLDKNRLKEMGLYARNHVKNMTFENAFLEMWDMYDH